MTIQLDRCNSRVNGSKPSGGACDRNGATIIEVMFSIGVLLFGLIGIAAFIPAASKLARNSIDLNRGASIGQTVTQEFNARGYGNSNRWVKIYDDAQNPVVAVALKHPLTSGPSAVAIDNLFVSRPENLIRAGDVIGINTGAYNQFDNANSNYFRRNQFPYYNATYNPLIDPRRTVNQAPWPAMPRLQRVAVNSGTSADIPPALVASRLVDDTDQLVFNAPEDKTLPVSQVMRIGSVAPSNADFPIPAARSGRPEYSWFATVQPQSATAGTLSVVVVGGRDRTFETPADGTAPSADPTEPLELSERLAYVNTWVADFRVGAGGTITLTATDKVSSKLNTDGWLMLIKSTPGGSRHAWYRIVQADREATFIEGFPDPNGGPAQNVWQRRVTLEGPDWTFTNAAGTVADDTLAVLVDGVISVTESTVPLR